MPITFTVSNPENLKFSDVEKVQEFISKTFNTTVLTTIRGESINSNSPAILPKKQPHYKALEKRRR
jgi:hypothetical protein